MIRTGLLSLHCLRGERYAEAYQHSLTAARHAAAQYANPEAVTLHRGRWRRPGASASGSAR